MTSKFKDTSNKHPILSCCEEEEEQSEGTDRNHVVIS